MKTIIIYFIMLLNSGAFLAIFLDRNSVPFTSMNILLLMLVVGSVIAATVMRIKIDIENNEREET